jgi:uncharacterized Zn finger protein (UPF0148 family)
VDTCIVGKTALFSFLIHFCSECIQRFLQDGNTECPQCGVQINGKSLTRNSSYATMAQCIVKLKNVISEEATTSQSKSRQQSNELFMSALEGFVEVETPDINEEQNKPKGYDEKDTIVSTLSSEVNVKRTLTKPTKLGILLTGLSEDQKSIVQTNLSRLSKLSGLPVKILKDFATDQPVTHVICACAPKAQCPRTLKYLLGIANKSWIISFNWILESLERGELLDEEAFIVAGDEAVQCDTDACRKSRMDSGKLFDKTKFYLAGLFNAPGPSKTDLMGLIQAAGGSLCKKSEPSAIKISNNSTGPKADERPYTWLFDALSFYDANI